MKTMMKLMSVSAVSMLMAANVAFAKPEVGQAAPAFDLLDTYGNEVSLASLQGKTVVLEWTNHDCPFVRKHYESDNMQALQKEAVADDVVWMSVISSGEGKQGYVSPEQANALTAERGASPTHVLLDPNGDLGQLYEAKTTPHMFVINAEGKVAYMGGIDDIPSANKADVDGAENYVRTALSELNAGQAVSTSTTRAYGCSVKYKS